MHTPKNSSFAHLTPADRDQLLQWCDRMPYDQAADRAALPRHLGGLGFHPSRSALARFYARHGQYTHRRDLLAQLAKTLELDPHTQQETLLGGMLDLLEQCTFRALLQATDNPDPYLPPVRLILQIKKYRDKKRAGQPAQTPEEYFASLDAEDAQKAAEAVPHPDLNEADDNVAVSNVAVCQDPAAPNPWPEQSSAPVNVAPDDQGDANLGLPICRDLLDRAAAKLAEILPFTAPDQERPKPKAQPPQPTAQSAQSSQPEAQPEAQPPQSGNPTENPRNPAFPASATPPPPASPSPVVVASAAASPQPTPKPARTLQTQKTPFYLGALKRR